MLGFVLLILGGRSGSWGGERGCRWMSVRGILGGVFGGLLWLGCDGGVCFVPNEVMIALSRTYLLMYTESLDPWNWPEGVLSSQ